MHKIIVASLPQGNSVRNTLPNRRRRRVAGNVCAVADTSTPPHQTCEIAAARVASVQHAHNGIDFRRVERASPLREFRGGGGNARKNRDDGIIHTKLPCAAEVYGGCIRHLT